MKNRNIFFICFLIAGLYSCSPAYQLLKDTKLDNVAISRAVVRPATVMKPIADMFNALNPITQKPTVTIERDTLIVSKVDSAALKEAYAAIESLLKVKCPDMTEKGMDSLKVVFEKEFRKTIHPDTIRTGKTVIHDIDSTCQIAMVSLRIENTELKIKNALLQGQVTQQAVQIVAEKKNGNKWLWFFVGVCVLMLLENIFLLYKSFKPKIK